MRLFCLAFSVLLCAGLSQAAPQWHVPQKGGAERAQIMTALRNKLAEYDPQSRELVFVVKELCVADKAGWLSVEAQSRDGQSQLEPIQAVLKYGKSGWVVSTLACAEEECRKGSDAVALRARVNPQCL